MNKKIAHIKLFLEELDQKAQGVLIVTLNHEVVCYNELFKDIWAVSEKSLRSRNEIACLKEAIKKIDDPHLFYAYVISMYQKDSPENNIVKFKNGSTVEAVPYFINVAKSKLIGWTARINANKKNKMKMLSLLTSREKQILYHYLFGFTVKTIASALSISARTAESHIENLKKKFDCYHRDDFIRVAKLLGLVSIESSGLVTFLHT